MNRPIFGLGSSQFEGIPGPTRQLNEIGDRFWIVDSGSKISWWHRQTESLDSGF